MLTILLNGVKIKTETLVIMLDSYMGNCIGILKQRFLIDNTKTNKKLFY